MMLKYKNAVAKKGDIMTVWGAITELEKRIAAIEEAFTNNLGCHEMTLAWETANRRQAKEKAPVSEDLVDDKVKELGLRSYPDQ